MRRLEGRRVLVTGASGGIGRAVVDRLRAEGAVVAGVDLVLPDGLQLDFAARADVCDEASVAAVVEATVASLGGLDTLVAAAGIEVSGPTHEVPASEFRRVLEVNVMGTVLLLRAVIPRMLHEGEGRIVTFGSTAAVVAAPELAAYAAAKGAVLQLTRSVAAEYAERGIRANCICPGGTRTPMLAAIDRERSASDRFLERHPIGRYAEPAEIAAAVAFLVSEDASFVVGSALMVDGGYTCM